MANPLFQSPLVGALLGTMVNQNTNTNAPIVSPTAAPEPPVRKGMFGIKGTFRDILGTLGDALLMGNNQQAMYAPRRQQEKIADALFDYQTNPQQAIQRLSNAGFVSEADKMRKSLSETQLNQARQNAEQDKAVGTYAQYVNTLTPENYKQYAPALNAYAKSRGLAFPPLPDTYNESEIASRLNSGMKVYESERLKQYEKGLEETERHHRETAANTRRGQDKADARAAASRSAADRRQRRSIEAADRRASQKGAGKYRTNTPPPTKFPGWSKFTAK